MAHTPSTNQNITRVLIGSHISEKGSRILAHRTHIFYVRESATKPMVRREIERRYNVKVTSVNILREKRKPTRFGMKTGVRSRRGIKKAMVTLKEGHIIESE